MQGFVPRHTMQMQATLLHRTGCNVSGICRGKTAALEASKLEQCYK